MVSTPVFLAVDVSGDRLVLDGPEGRHAATVRRLRVGEAVDVVDGAGHRASGVVAALGRDRVEIDVIRRTAEATPDPRLVLVQAIAKGDRAELAVELATEVGIDEVVPWRAARSVVDWSGERGEKARARWQATAREAAKQSRRAWVPAVAEAVTTAGLCDRLATAAMTLVLHETAEVRLTDVEPPAGGEVLLVVGPEGGLTDEELDRLRAAGARVVRLGPTVLRTSTAGAVAAAVVSSRTSRWA